MAPDRDFHNNNDRDSDNRDAEGDHYMSCKLSYMDDICDGAIHPLLMYHVLDKIFEYAIAPIKEKGNSKWVARDVKNFRLVCKVWLERSTLAFRNMRAPTIFGIFSQKESLLQSDVEKFLDTMKSSRLVPVRSYKISELGITRNNPQIIKYLLEFIQLEVMTVELCDVIWDLKAGLFPDWSSSSFHFAKLTTLKATIYFRERHNYENTVEEKGQYPLKEEMCLLGRVLISAPKLVHLSIRICFQGTGYFPRKLEKVLRNIPETVKKFQLILPTLHSDPLKIISRLALKLEAVEVITTQNLPPVCNDVHIRSFFECQRNTLKKLIWPINLSNKISRSFPPLLQLKELHFCGVGAAPPQPIPFSATFPNITVLNLSSLDFKNECYEFLQAIEFSPSVEELHLPKVAHLSKLVVLASQCIPNLRRLYLNLRNHMDLIEGLQKVFAYFCGIRELTIDYYGKLSFKIDGDALLSGVPKNDCAVIREEKDFKNVNLSNFQKHPSILQLTKLKRLTLQLGGHILFSDFSARLIFLKMSCLEELHGNCAFRKISRESEDLLRIKLKVLTGMFAGAWADSRCVS